MNFFSARQIYFFLFALSGFSGLIYESIWSHYLKLFLGHAAYAQTLVLVIFMGGMAVGAWAVGRRTESIKNPLLIYALVEAVVGVMALGFHPVFVSCIDLSYQSIIPAIDSTALIIVFKWSLTGLLILPQSILLGSTFPLMTAGIVRKFPVTPGRSIATLYFLNSLGASIGVLVSGFVLIAWVGLPGTIMIAGLINLLLAVVVWTMCHQDHHPSKQVDNKTKQIGRGQNSILFLIVAAMTGAASFLYEIGWIRMLSLVLGSSTHAFELMLSSFILGLALGGYWIRKRIDQLANVLITLALIQIIMGLCALGSLLIYNDSFEMMRYIISALSKNDQGYQLFNILSHGLAMMIMLPTTICAGMTLPLITWHLLSTGWGERSIGAIYSANTVGAIVGVIVAVQLLMPVLGVKSLIIVGSGLDIGLGLVLLRYTDLIINIRRWSISVVLLGLIFLPMIFLFRLDPLKMASGVYLHGNIRSDREILFHKDGKSATIAFFRSPGFQVISTNGKTDAAIGINNPSKDEPTMVMVAALAMSIHQSAKQAAVIGMGSGLTTHSLLSNPSLEKVDTIEIEPAMVEAARGFGSRVHNTFNDPRGHIYIDDAKAFFTKRKSQYDIIVSEPSNPWVSGVAGLFSKEFYQLIGHHLKTNGVFVQWLHLYQINMPLVASVVKALSPHFEDYVVYALNLSDMVIVARQQGKVGLLHEHVFYSPALQKELSYLGIQTLQDLKLHRLGSKTSLDPLFFSYPISANSDYYPVLDLGAIRSRFLNQSATEIIDLKSFSLPLIEVLENQQPTTDRLLINQNHHYPIARHARQAMAIRDLLLTGSSKLATQDTLTLFYKLKTISTTCDLKQLSTIWMPALHRLGDLVLPYLAPEEINSIWTSFDSALCYDRLSDNMHNWIDLYRSIGMRDFSNVLIQVQALLPADPIKASYTNNYLLMAGIMAEIATDNYPAALSLWNRYQPDGELSLVMRLIGAHIESMEQSEISRKEQYQ